MSNGSEIGVSAVGLESFGPLHPASGQAGDALDTMLHLTTLTMRSINSVHYKTCKKGGRV